MVKMRYVGLGNAVDDFEKLTPLVKELERMKLKCRPFGADYHALSVALDAINTTAYHFTRRPHFYSNLSGGQG